MSKYKKELLEHAEEYCTKLGLDPRLIHFPRTKLQADTLYEIQFDCEISHRGLYQGEKDTDTSNPKREQKKTLDLIRDLKKQLSKYHFIDEMKMIGELSSLEERIDINNRWRKPRKTLDSIEASIIEQLIGVGFSMTNINDNIVPVFKDMIKNEKTY